MATPTYRSINLTATLLAIDRRLCIVILIVAFLVFRHFTFAGKTTHERKGLPARFARFTREKGGL
jgi:hypothetical protein